ncbi:MAG TPA: DUF2721 domain-containing protein [Sphingomicrobium sp.]|nr:DUF2721 domain-containing protein [Sphingomicrobium sp.]
MIPIPPPETRVTEIADIIQSVLAPVFLLAGIGGFLNVLTGRLARMVDRARNIEPKLLKSRASEHDRLLRELRLIDRRMALVGRAIWLTVLAALLICFVVILLFAGTLVSGHFGRAIAVLFMLCMLFLGSGFAFFLVETRIGARAVRIRNALLEHEAEERD